MPVISKVCPRNWFTVFAWSDAVATIYFIAQFCGVSIRELWLIKNGVNWYQWTWPSSPDHSHVFNAHGGSGDGEKSDPFADIEPRTKIRGERTSSWWLLTVYKPRKPYPIHTTIITVLLLCARATQIVAAASTRERPLFLLARLEVRLLFQSGD